MRRSLSQKERQTMLADQKGLCNLCGGALDPSSMIAEHWATVANGNDQKPDCLLCGPCAHEKTYGTKATTKGSDIHSIARTKRLYKRHVLGEPKRRKGRQMASRPFPERPEGHEYRWPKRKVGQ